MIATSGRLITGVEAIAAERAERQGDGRARQLLALGLALARGFGEAQDLGRELPQLLPCASRITGTISPVGVCVAMPRWTAPWRVTTLASSS